MHPLLSEIIDSESKLLATKKKLVIRFGIEDALKEAPKGSLMRRLSEKGMHLVGVRPEEEMSAIIKDGLVRYYFFERNVALPFMLAVLSPYASSQNYVAFMEAKPYHEIIDVFYLRRSLDADKKRFIHKR